MASVFGDVLHSNVERCGGRSGDGLRMQFMMPVGDRYAYIARSSAISSHAMILNRAGLGVRPHSVPGLLFASLA